LFNVFSYAARSENEALLMSGTVWLVSNFRFPRVSDSETVVASVLLVIYQLIEVLILFISSLSLHSSFLILGPLSHAASSRCGALFPSDLL
jgi:hypothetical protein